MNYNVPPEFQIHLAKRSTVKTVNNYPKKDVIEKFIGCIKGGLVTDANYWCAELLVSGFFSQLWDLLIDYYFKYLVCAYPILIAYVHQQQILINGIKKAYTGNLPGLPNNQELRNHLCEMVSIFCLCERQPAEKTVRGQIAISEANHNKADQIIQLLVPNLSQDSAIYKHFHSFIINYYDVSDPIEETSSVGSPVGLQNCRYYLDWFVKDTQHTIAPFHDFKVSPTFAQRCIWLIWKFLLSNLKNQPELTASLDIAIEIFLINYRKKNYEICINILWYVLLLARQPEKIQLDNRVDFSHYQLIHQSAEINFIYQNLIQKSTDDSSKATKKPKAKKLTQQEQSKIKFYENPKNKDFLQAINDVTLLVASEVEDTAKTNSQSDRNDHVQKSQKGRTNRDSSVAKASSVPASDELIIHVPSGGRHKSSKSKISLGE